MITEFNPDVVFTATSSGDHKFCCCDACHAITGVTKISRPVTKYHDRKNLETRYFEYWLCDACLEKLRAAIAPENDREAKDKKSPKKAQYGCDGGCIVIGNESCRVSIPNGIGDGGYTVKVLEKGTIAPKGAFFAGIVKGNDIRVYSYDCGTLTEEEEMMWLSGEFYIYTDHGDIFLIGG